METGTKEWIALGVVLALIVSLVLVQQYLEDTETWHEVTVDGITVLTNLWPNDLKATFFPDQKRIQLFDERPDGRDIRITDFSKVSNLPCHVIVSGEGYSYSQEVTTNDVKFHIPHFSWANITVVSANSTYSADSGGDINIFVPDTLINTTVAFTVNSTQYVESPGLLRFTGDARIIEVGNFTYSGNITNETVSLDIELVQGMNYLTLSGNVTDYSWEISGESSFNLSTYYTNGTIDVKNGWYQLLVWFNATVNYSSPQLKIALPVSGNHDNSFLSVYEGLSNITSLGGHCHIDSSFIYINCTDINKDVSRLYDVTYKHRDNLAPTIKSTPDKVASVDVTHTDLVIGKDLDPEDELTYELLIKPPGMLINETTGVIKWMPLYEGSFRVTVQVSDGIDNVTQTYTLVIENSWWDRFADQYLTTTLITALIGAVMVGLVRYVLVANVGPVVQTQIEEFKEDNT